MEYAPWKKLFASIFSPIKYTARFRKRRIGHKTRKKTEKMGSKMENRTHPEAKSRLARFV
jgi:hypothetical protein